ncbi:MAG: RidA family protein [Starkeya sp.]|nr:RidA family protein [Starkeya sp.]
MTGRRRISSGSAFEAEAGYSRAVVDGNDIFVSGTTGYDYAAMELPEDLVAQTHGCFRNIAAALAEAGASLDDVVRVRYIVTEADYAATVFPIFGQYFAKARPAATLIVAGLLQPQMKIEIEVTARRQG